MSELVRLVTEKTHIGPLRSHRALLRIKKLACDELNTKGIFRLPGLCTMEMKQKLKQSGHLRNHSVQEKRSVITVDPMLKARVRNSNSLSPEM